ncbi:NTP transferase domain-containing protein [bacterium]|nr:NTP transferase domain-containing protein [bacterium]
MDVVVLCGGIGTRLKSVLPDRQKVLADVGERPFLFILLDDAIRQGFSRFVFCAGFGAEDLERTVRAAYGTGTGLVFSVENRRLGTAGAIRHAAEHIRTDPFLVLNGDSFCPFEYPRMAEFHAASKSRATVALVEASPDSDGGFVKIDDARRVTGFREKSFEASHSFLNAGVYLFPKNFLGRIPAGQSASLELDVFPSMLADGVYGYPTGSSLFDIGTPDRLAKFRREFQERKA